MALKALETWFDGSAPISRKVGFFAPFQVFIFPFEAGQWQYLADADDWGSAVAIVAGEYNKLYPGTDHVTLSHHFGIVSRQSGFSMVEVRCPLGRHATSADVKSITR